MLVLLRLLSPLLGLAVAAASALLAVEAGWALARPGSAPLLVRWRDWRDRLAGYEWSDTTVMVADGVLAALGLLLVWVLRHRLPGSSYARHVAGARTTTSRGHLWC
jgi:hypothetical protein